MNIKSIYISITIFIVLNQVAFTQNNHSKVTDSLNIEKIAFSLIESSHRLYNIYPQDNHEFPKINKEFEKFKENCILIANSISKDANVDKNYLLSIKDDISGMNTIINEGWESFSKNEEMQQMLQDILQDLELKSNDIKSNLQFSREPVRTVTFTVVTKRISNGNAIDINNYKVRANGWINRTNPVPRHTFNDQLTSPGLQITLPVCYYDIWVEYYNMPNIKLPEERNKIKVETSLEGQNIEIIVP